MGMVRSTYWSTVAFVSEKYPTLASRKTAMRQLVGLKAEEVRLKEEAAAKAKAEEAAKLEAERHSASM